MITPTTGVAGAEAEEVVVIARSQGKKAPRQGATSGKPGILPGLCLQTAQDSLEP